MLGSLLALSLAPGNNSKPVNELLSITGLILILFTIFTFDDQTPFPGLAALLPCLGKAMIIYAGESQQTLVTRILSVKPLVFIGMISYSLYLWHWPLFAFLKNYLVRDLNHTEAALVILAAFILASLSWRFIEQPFRGKKALFRRKTLFQGTVVCMGLFITVGLFFDSTKGFPDRLPADVLKIAHVALDKPVDRKKCEGIKPEHVSFENLCRINGQKKPPSFILWGDSHAAV